jgi:hypothetical protein
MLATGSPLFPALQAGIHAEKAQKAYCAHKRDFLANLPASPAKGTAV